MNKGLFFSSKTDEWSTPQSLFDELNATHHFTLDPAATHENAKVKKHFTVAEDGLRQSWGGGDRFLQSTLRAQHRNVGP